MREGTEGGEKGTPTFPLKRTEVIFMVVMMVIIKIIILIIVASFDYKILILLVVILFGIEKMLALCGVAHKGTSCKESRI